MTVNIKLLTDTAYFPCNQSAGAAGYDLYADIIDPIAIAPHQTLKIHTGIALALPDGTAGLILPRSGLATKEGLRPANTPGLIDSDYRGEIIVALHNDTEERKIIHKGDRIAQLMVIPYFSVDFLEVKELDETDRGSSGFGSTGK